MNMRNQYLWHCHHQQLIEKQTYPVQERKAYIRTGKPPCERDLRLLLFHKAKIKAGKEREAVLKYIDFVLVTPLLRKLHKEQCVHDCPWSYKHQNIFTKFSATKNRYVTKTGRTE